MGRTRITSWIGASFAVALLTATISCGGSTSTAPGPVSSDDGGTLPSTGSAAIDGRVTSRGGGASAESFLPSPANVDRITVRVVGTDLRTVTDAEGDFQLRNVPGGDLQLSFQKSGSVDGRVAVNDVGRTDHVQVTVALQGSTVDLVNVQAAPQVQFQGGIQSLVAGAPPGTWLATLDDAAGTQVQLDSSTWIDSGGDLLSLQAIVDAFNTGDSVQLDGQGIQRPMFIDATAIKAVVTAAGAQFDGEVQSVDGSAQAMTLTDSTVVAVDGSTVWDPLGDVFSFGELETVFLAGNVVNVDGSGTPQPDGSILAADIQARVEKTGFAGTVLTADPATQQITVDDGNVVAIDPNTVWETSGNSGGAGLGNIDSVDEIATHLSQGTRVDVDGSGILLADGSILASRIKAKPEDDDDDDDDDGPGVDFSAEVALLDALIGNLQAVLADPSLNSLNGGQSNALLVKLQNARASLERGNGNPAIGQLGAFLNQLDAFSRTGRVDAAAAASLSQETRQLIAAIQAKTP